MCQAAQGQGARVRTFVIPSIETEKADRHVGGMVFAVRVDPPPDRLAEQAGHVGGGTSTSWACPSTAGGPRSTAQPAGRTLGSTAGAPGLGRWGR
jgi:hypothetical protein